MMHRIFRLVLVACLIGLAPVLTDSVRATAQEPAQAREPAQIQEPAQNSESAEPSVEGRLKVLFLGDNGHHQPRLRFGQLKPVMAEYGIDLTYTDDMADINAANLAEYAALLVYANIDAIEPEAAQALLDYVAQGGGFVPLHCASYCFRNDPRIVSLIGAQFLRHGTGVFRTQIAEPEHPIMQGYGGFESWDETYVHHLHNEQQRTVLAYRVDESGREPWTWVRTHGQGRVFYTAWGHDHRTFSNPGFQNLVARGILWAAGRDPRGAGEYLADRPFPVPEMTPQRTDVQPFEYIDVGPKIPNYTPGERWGSQGEAYTKMQKPLAPEESLKHYVVPKGFHVELFASEPDIGGKPIAMAWDARGRLWVAETYDYPNELQPPGKGRDRVRILEDTDGDWKADKFTVFAEGLSIPTSIAFANGGVIVQDGANTLFLRDVDGDDRCDEQHVLFGNWNMGDTHGGVSNFQYGLDNWMWAMQGYNYSEPTIDGQKQQGFRMGFFRFRPDGSAIEFLRSTDNNTWGLGISEDGLIFGSTANRNPSVFLPIPNRYYEAVKGWAPSLVLKTIADTYLFDPITDRVRQVDQHGGYTAAAGHALYTARTYPREYWNRTAFVSGPTGHLVGTFVLKPSGSGFTSTSPFNLIASDDEWSAPIMAEVGPDGNVWISDWYNYIVQHNPTPAGFETGKGNAYVTDLRDKKHGRILRVVYDEAPRAEPFSLQHADADQLVATLNNPTMLWRKHAQRLLVERGEQDVVPALVRLVRDQSTDAVGLNVAAIHALWTLHGLQALDVGTDAFQAAVSALQHPSAGVRRNALQVLPPASESVTAVLESGAVDDPDLQVRLTAFLALADQPATDAVGRALVRAIQEPDNLRDRWIPDAVTSAAAHNGLQFLKALANNTETPEPIVAMVEIVAEHLARTRQTDAVRELVPALVQAEPAVVEAVIRGLERGWPADTPVELSTRTEAQLDMLLEKLSDGARGALVKLATTWGSERFAKYANEIVGNLLEQLDDQTQAVAQRVAAARQLVAFQPKDDQTVRQLLQRVSPQTAPEVAAGIVQALRASEAPETGELLLQRLPVLTPSTRQAALAVMLTRPTSTRVLLDGADAGVVQLSDLSLEQKTALAEHPDRDIRRHARALLERGGALPSADRQQVLEELLPLVEQTGDVAAGREVYKKHCAKCHVHGTLGSRIGPDLTGMAVHPKEEMLTNIIDPNRSVEGNFRVYTVVTIDGLVINGLLASESRTAIELFDVEGNKKTVLRDEIDELQASRRSLMPEGFEKQVPPAQLVDLLEFLAHRGQYVPVDLRKAATASSGRGMFVNREADVERLVFPDYGLKTFKDIPFQVIDPQDGRVPNVILLHSPRTRLVQAMPRSVSVPCHGPARAIHLLSGVSGWGFPFSTDKTVSMIVRLHYADGQIENHELRNGQHFADYIRHVDVPDSELAFRLRQQQIRYLAVHPQREEPIETIEFVKGPDQSAPVVMAVTIETR